MPPRSPRLSHARISGLLALAISLVAAAPASAQLLSAPVTTKAATPDLIDRAEERGAIDLETANLYRAYALRGDDRLPEAYESGASWRGTLPLLELREKLTRMEPGPKRRAVAEALRVPAGTSASVCSDSASALPDATETAHFYIQYDEGTLHPSLTIQDYKESLEEAYLTEVGSYAWAAPPSTALGQTALEGKYHVRVDSLDSNLYGFVSPSGTYAGNVSDNTNTPWNEGDAFASCMALNQNFDPFEGSAQQALDATTAHEYAHSLQFGYGTLIGGNVPDDHFIEGSATWMEDEAQDGANDNYNYLYPRFNDSMGEHQGNVYAYWLTFRGLTERFGSNTPGGGEEVMQDLWEIISRDENEMLVALQTAVANKGRTLAETYHDYAVAAKFMRSCGASGFLPYCFEEAAGYTASPRGNPPAPLGVPASHGAATTSTPRNGLVEDDYTLNWIDLPSSGLYDVTLSNTSAGGQLRATVACATATGVAIAPFPADVGGGQSQTIPGFNAGSCAGSTPVVAITNQFQSAANPSSSAARSYSVSLTQATSGSADAEVPGQVTEEAPDNSGFVPPPGAASSGTTPNSGAIPAARDTVRPVVTGIGFSNRRFRAARSGAAIRAAAPLGTRVRYRLSEAATVAVRYERKTIGRRVNGRCRAATRANSKRAKCVRWVLVRGTARHRGKAGANAFRLTGRMNRRAMRPGVYRLRLSARDAAGNATATPRRSARFRILRR